MPSFRYSLLLGVSGAAMANTVCAEPVARVETAKPVYASAAETKLRQTLMAHLKPLLAAKFDNEQVSTAQQALKLIRAGKLEAATLLESKITDPVLAKLVQWKRLQRRSGFALPTDYAGFLKENPVWPRRKIIQRYYEAALLREGGSAAQIKSYFAASKPVSGAGYAALASAELALGNDSTAKKLAARAWCFERMPKDLEKNFTARFAKQLTAADHQCRLNRLLVGSPRNHAIRRSRVKAATRLLPKLSEAERKKATVRIALFAGRKAFKDLRAIVKQPALIKGDWGLNFQRIVRSRRKKDYTHAFKLLTTVPADHPSLINRDAWWKERERHARYWLGKGNVRRAYDIAAGARPDNANAAKQQAFFSGWLALMRLGKPKDARAHFKRMVKHADGPLSKSMSEYWLARAHEKIGDKKRANGHFTESASIRDSFHGLLSRRAILPKTRSIKLPPAEQPDRAQVQRFLSGKAVKGLLAAYAVKLSRRDVLSFYKVLGNALQSEGEFALLAQMASAVGDGQGEVRVGKSGIARGFNLFEFAYPVHLLPAYEPLREPVERAMLLGIARQESEFNTRIISRAGARGVLQVMPITARHICRQYRIKCRLKDLLEVPSYNARIASAYIADRRDDFSGSYILTLTGFNAGPGRTRQWLRQMGDPRSANIKPLDWIYRIPFLETRLYVRKVLSNVQIYRARLGDKNPLRLDKDLLRGRQ
jgi:soluble lytic murein transglycosylase